MIPNKKNEDFADQIFHKMGVRGKINMEKFWRKTISEIGQDANNLYECIQSRSSGVASDPYPLKNKSLPLANAVASQYDSSRIKSFIIWLLNEGIALEGRVLEVGCDNGILTCALASKFPSASFVGIDPCPEAINLARKRAVLLGLANCEFRVADAGAYAEEVTGIKFAVVMAMHVAHEVLSGGMIAPDFELMSSPEPDFSLYDHDKNLLEVDTKISFLESLNGLLEEDGVLISIDRWGAAIQLLKWIRFAERSGLRIDLNSSTVLEVEADEKEYFPLTVFRRRSGGRVDIADALALSTVRRFPNKGVIHVLHGSAELLFNGLVAADLFAVDFKYINGSGTLRIRFGVAQGVGYIYQSTSRGYRELLLFPSVCLLEIIGKTREVRSALRNTTKASVIYSDRILAKRLQIDLDGILRDEEILNPEVIAS